jgi:hypothetical protein
MDYHIRPMDLKHATVLPVGQEAEFKIKNDRLMLKVVDGDKKTRAYQVVSMQPISSDSKTESTAYHSAAPAASDESRLPNTNANGTNRIANQTATPPPPQQ